ncbi:EutN/CcmL family microcompartment protein [candidate division CSSED10-310 bacterium]|uniref:EutN/CcmL family microcompartment protein n=1 Tax=candidate division CSSED10-310 bacterium TaxID=2855610 RepID=A0ABV6Z251_UNCC1
MDRCYVLGTIWATRKVAELEGFKMVLLAVKDYTLKNTSKLVVAVDILDVSPGDDVLITYGSGARNVLGNQELPIDAVVAGIVSEEV